MVEKNFFRVSRSWLKGVNTIKFSQLAECLTKKILTLYKQRGKIMISKIFAYINLNKTKNLCCKTISI